MASTHRKSSTHPKSKAFSAHDLAQQVAAINRTQAVIEFDLQGVILAANDNFLKAMGYSREEVIGKHHSMFVAPAYAASAEYRQFWEKLGRGESDSAEYCRIGKGGREVWIQASYNPILDPRGKPYKVVKFAVDVTARRLEAELNAAYKGALDNLLSNVMVADTDFNIRYMNNTVRDMLQNAQTDIRKDLPHFDVNRLIGTNIDVFHKNPAHQRGVVGNLTKTISSEFVLGGRTLRVIASPMLDPQGKRLGTVVEWADRTAELAAEREVQAIVDAIVEGRLDRRIPLEGKKGFFEALAKGINRLVENIAEAVEGAQRVVDAANAGDLTQRIELEGRSGLTIKIVSGIQQLTQTLADIVTRVKAAAGEVSRGADEISQGNTNLSQRTEEQASSLEETASSMEQMTSTVKQTADNAGQANQLAIAAREQADKGGTVVGKAVQAMGEINDASKKIADIISVIDEIAFQTNLLALNAAVEAARAGEQGRGFAVVASEVRNLAGRSATAAKEIKGLIQDSVKKIDEGSLLVSQSGQTLEQIVSAVRKVSDIIAEIAAAGQEQSAGVEQVNKAVMQLDETTQQNAALVEQASAASQAMAEQARALNQLLARYQVAEQSGVAASVAKAAPEPTPKVGAPGGVERRGPGRPWSGAEKKPAATAKPKAPAPAATGTDPDWKEF